MLFNKPNNIKGFTYISSTEPDSNDCGIGDTWFDTKNDRVMIFDGEYLWSIYDKSKIIYGLGSHYGYSSMGSTINRITFPFDSGTSNVVFTDSNYSNDLAVVTDTNQGCNSSVYGYFTNARNININRITFPFDTGNVSTKGSLPTSRTAGDDIAACNSSNYGYFCGGTNHTSDTTKHSSISRITFPFDTGNSTHVGNLSHSAVDINACNSSIYGYIYTIGSNAERNSIIDRIIFPFDSGTSIKAGTVSVIMFKTACCNSSIHGFNIGGKIFNNFISNIERITFPFDSGTGSTAHTSNLSSKKCGGGSFNSTTHGYYCGGYDGSNNYSIIERLSFPFDTSTSVHVGNLSGSSANNGGFDGVDFVTQFI